MIFKLQGLSYAQLSFVAALGPESVRDITRTFPGSIE